MSHILQSTNNAAPRMVAVTIVNYTSGGEQFSPAELGIVPPLVVDAVVFGPCGPTQNSLKTMLFPSLTGAGVLTLYYISGGALVEIPTTLGLNAEFSALIHQSLT
jgi:hypothetical protein